MSRRRIAILTVFVGLFCGMAVTARNSLVNRFSPHPDRHAKNVKVVTGELPNGPGAHRCHHTPH